MVLSFQRKESYATKPSNFQTIDAVSEQPAYLAKFALVDETSHFAARRKSVKIPLSPNKIVVVVVQQASSERNSTPAR